MMVHKSPNGCAVLRAVDETEYVALNEIEYLINFFAEGAKAYWRQWGPLGEPVVYAVEEWAHRCSVDIFSGCGKSLESEAGVASKSPKHPLSIKATDV
jgi:hypothetical protein